MSILIKDMEMPKNELEMLILAIKSNGSIFPVRIDGDGNPMIFQNEEMQNRAVPVPEPHGDLIDRKALLEGEGRYLISLCKEGIDVEEILRAKTVIPATEEE